MKSLAKTSCGKILTVLLLTSAATLTPLDALAEETNDGKLSANGLSPLEQDLYEETMAKFNAVNPIDPATGKRSYIAFGFVTDEHVCKRVEGDDAPKDPLRNYWYYAGSTLTRCDQTFRVLGAVATAADLDAVFNGGDFSTGNSIAPLTDEDYLANVRAVKALCTDLLPKTPVFSVDGNHDRNYPAHKIDGTPTPGHRWNDSQWRTALDAFNSDVSTRPDITVTWHRDLAQPTVGPANPGVYTGNTYHVDFTRLQAKGQPNIRFICVSEYDTTPGNGLLLRLYDGFQFYDSGTKELIDPAKTPENTLICVISHGNIGNTVDMAASLYMTAGHRKGASTQQAPLSSNLGIYKGLGVIGAVAGHAHQTLVKPIDKTGRHKSSCVQVNAAFANARKALTRASYTFSVFTIDTDRRKLIETRVADGNVTNYETEIDLNSEVDAEKDEDGDDGEGKMNNEKESSVDLSALLPDEIKCVSIVAPASHASSNSIAACVLALEKAGKKVKVLPGVWKHLPNGADRARQIEQAWKDPETDLILCARGGSGSYDTLKALDFDILKSRNVPFMGFSNISTLLCGFVKMGVGRPIGGPSASSLATYPHTGEAIRRVHDVLARAPLPPTQLTVRRAPAATVTGKPLGGHLPSFASMKRDDGLLPDMTNRIVFVEYNKSYSYTSATNVFRLAKDRGWFNGATAVVLCDMGISEGGKKEQLRKHITESVSCPVFSGYDYGHIKGLLAIDYERELSITPSGLLTWSD